MSRIDDRKDGGDRLAGLSPAVSGPPGPTVIQFPRRATAAALGSAGCSETSSGHPSFQPLGPIVQAVVMRLQDDRVRLQVMIPSGEGLTGGVTPDGTDDGSLGG